MIDKAKHEEHLNEIENLRKFDNKDPGGDALSQYPALVLDDHSKNLWNGDMPDVAAAFADAEVYTRQYKREAQ